MVTDGDTDIMLVEAAVLHVYVFAPLAVKVAGNPSQTAVVEEAMESTGRA